MMEGKEVIAELVKFMPHMSFLALDVGGKSRGLMTSFTKEFFLLCAQSWDITL